MPQSDDDAIDWSLTTWEGAEREQLRRWARLSLEEIVRAQEQMQDLSERLAKARAERAEDGTAA
jgi:tRNA(Phe) wybutosine-synthesizing methylase Tyw3